MSAMTTAYERDPIDPYIGVRKVWRFLEDCIFIYLLLHFSGALLSLLLIDPNDLEADSPIQRLLWYPSYLMIAGLAVLNLPRLLKLVVFNPLIVLCVLVCGLSYFWSIDPSLTMRRSIAILMTTTFGLVLAARYGWYELVQRLAIVYAILAVGSLFMSVAVPNLGQMQEIHQGAWRGLWLEKNSFGAQMAKGLLIFMCAFAMRPQRGLLWVPMGVLAFFLILMCTSKTALLAAVLMIGGMVFVRIMRANPILRIPVMYFAIVGTVIMGFAVTFFSAEMLALIGKDPTLTGRTDIWDALYRAGMDHPWLGYGYGTFWQDPLGPSYYVRFELEWGVPTAHNGWVETWLSTGLLGVGCFAVTYLVTLLLGLDRLARGGVENYWVLLSTLLFGMLSLSESTILQQNIIDWVIFTATSAKMFAFEPAFWRDGRPVRSYWHLRQSGTSHTVSV